MWRMGGKIEWDGDLSIRWPNRRHLSLASHRWPMGKTTHVWAKPVFVRTCDSRINKHVRTKLLSLPGCAPGGVGSTWRSAEVTSSPCLGLKTSLWAITNFSGPILAVGPLFVLSRTSTHRAGAEEGFGRVSWPRFPTCSLLRTGSDG